MTQEIVRPRFVAFDERKALRIHKRNLPHWSQDGVTYFVTFRLADSIPLPVRQMWEGEKVHWLHSKGIVYDGENGQWRVAFAKLPPKEQYQFHKKFNKQVHKCLDSGLGSCCLKNSNCIEIVRAKLLDQDGVSFHLGDFVIMPNHVHALITPMRGERLEAVLKHIKGGSAIQCNRILRRIGMFWQSESYDHIVRTLKQLEKFREYIAENPFNAKIMVPDSARFVASWMDAWFRTE